MKRIFKTSILTVLALLMALTVASCKKKEVKKIAVDSQFALSLFNDTISLKEILNDMDSTTNSWLRVRNDSIFAYYADSVNGVLKASDLLGNIEDVDFNTLTDFTMPMFDPTNNHDTIVDVDKFMTVPFDYDGFDIDEVVLRSGVMSFDFEVVPPIEQLKRIEVYSNHMQTPEGEPLVIAIDYNKGRQSVDLSHYRILPENDTVSFSARVTIHVDHGVYPGGEYVCNLTGGLTDVRFQTVYATVTKTLDSVFTDHADIDFGINGLSGSAYLPVPKINLTYKNTFGMNAVSDVTTLEFYNGSTGLVTDLLAADHWEETVYPTNGQYFSKRIGNFVDEIDALAGYTRLDFDGRVTMAMPGETISISDTSTVDVIADVEMPLSFRISDLRYIDTVEVNFGEDVNVQNYLDEIDFFVDYTNRIPLQLNLQCLFMRNGDPIDSLFYEATTLYYNIPSSLNPVIITDQKLTNVMCADHMLLRIGASTEFQQDPVMLLESNNLALRIRMLTKTSQIDFDEE